MGHYFYSLCIKNSINYIEGVGDVVISLVKVSSFQDLRSGVFSFIIDSSRSSKFHIINDYCEIWSLYVII